MNVFMTGATGYIGSVVAELLLLDGHSVSGLARSDASAERLESRGIRVVRGDLNDSQTLLQAARAADGVIHAAMDSGNALNLDLHAVESFLLALEETGKPFVYTSGVWVLGDTGGETATEASPVHPVDAVAWRPPVEVKVLQSVERGIRAMVLRPGIVHGRGGGIPAMMARNSAAAKAVTFVGTGENAWPFIHVDDLADLYRRAMLDAPSGSVLHGVQEPSVRVKEMAEALSRGLGWEGRTQSLPLEEARKNMGGFADALALNQHVSAEKTRAMLQWKPRQSVLEDMETGSYAHPNSSG